MAKTFQTVSLGNSVNKGDIDKDWSTPDLLCGLMAKVEASEDMEKVVVHPLDALDEKRIRAEVTSVRSTSQPVPAHYENRTLRPPEDVLGEASPEDPFVPWASPASHHYQASVELFAEMDDLLRRVSLLVVRRRDAAPKILYPPHAIVQELEPVQLPPL